MNKKRSVTALLSLLFILGGCGQQDLLADSGSGEAADGKMTNSEVADSGAADNEAAEDMEKEMEMTKGEAVTGGRLPEELALIPQARRVATSSKFSSACLHALLLLRGQHHGIAIV